MARPRKDNLNYYPMDVDVVTSPKMMMAINEVGPDALAAFVAILGAIYSKSYWVPKDDKVLQVAPASLHMPADRFDVAYDALLEWGLLVEIAAESDVEKSLCKCGVAVTSPGIQEQYFTIKTRVISEKLPFLLIKPREVEQNPQF